jgi:hypothetical protein
MAIFAYVGSPSRRLPLPDSGIIQSRRLPDCRTPMTLELLTIDMFSDKVGQAFIVEETGFPALELTLIEAKALRNYGNAAREPFSLLFTSEGAAVQPQRIYALRHAALGLHRIFLVPIAGSQGKVTYQAIFN